MTDIEKKALALVNEVRPKNRGPISLEDARNTYSFMALCRAIEQHEAFRQEVSDAVETLDRHWQRYDPIILDFTSRFARFIIPKPIDPLVEVINDADDMVRKPDAPSYAEAIRAALAARGLEIREKQP